MFTVLPALAALPKRDLTVEMREVEEGNSSSYTVSTQSGHPPIEEQSVQVHNGEKFSLSMDMTMPMQ